MLRQKVLLAQSGDQDSMQDLIDQFTPLLKHYSRILYVEDSFNELVLSFIEIVHAIPLESLKNNNDGVIVKYIVTSLKNAYVAHVRKNKKEISLRYNTDCCDLTSGSSRDIIDIFYDRAYRT